MGGRGGQTSDKWAWSKQGGWEAGREAPEGRQDVAQLLGTGI